MRDRRIYVVFDSPDIYDPTKNVIEAERVLASALQEQGAIVRCVRIPKPIDDGKAGLDDYLLTRTANDFLALVEAAAVPDRPRKRLTPGTPVRNFEFVERTEANGEKKKEQIALPMDAILTSISQSTGEWPRRVGTSLFVPAPGGVSWITSPAALFGFVGNTTEKPPEFNRGAGFHTKEETFQEIRRTATSYLAVETLPHEPPIANHYYACDTPSPGDGTALDELVGRFCFETTIDADLFRAALATVLWGGAGGTRPAFLFDSADGRGAGKSKTASMLIQFAGGAIDLSTNEDSGIVKQRLLSADGLTKRIAVLDNVKSLKFSWAELEALITSPTISGKALYVGESQRPNNLLWIITLNGASLSTDMAQRCVVIRVKKPPYKPTWEEETRAFIESHRDALIADIIAFLRTEPQPLASYSRWGAWERDILSRLPEPSEAQAVIRERQAGADVECEESDTVEDHFREQLEQASYSAAECCVFIPSTIAMQWWNTATGERQSVTAVSRKLKQLIDAGNLRNITHCPSRAYGRGVRWVGEECVPNVPMNVDLIARIEASKQRSRFYGASFSPDATDD